MRFCLAGKYSWKSRINDASPRCFLSLRTYERGSIISWYNPHFQLPPPIFLYELAMANRKILALKFLPIFLCHKMGDQLLEPNLKFRQNNVHLHSPQRCLVWSLRWDLCLEPEKKREKLVDFVINVNLENLTKGLNLLTFLGVKRRFTIKILLRPANGDEGILNETERKMKWKISRI